MAKMGRPKKFDLDDTKTHNVFIGLCHIQSTQEEIAGVFRVSTITIVSEIKRHFGKDITFLEIHKRYSAGGKRSLRRSQFAMSRKNATMAIWLGKQYLGQVDYRQTEEMNKPITIVYKDAGSVDEVKTKEPKKDLEQ